MWKRTYKPYLVIGGLILLIFSVPLGAVKMLRGSGAKMASPFWKGASSLTPKEKKADLELLKLENHLLQGEIAKLQDLLSEEYIIQADLLHLQELSSEYLDKDAFFRRRYDELQHIVDLQLKAVPAKVIFRDVSSWNRSFWINVGSNSNERFGRLVIAKNSPVVANNSLIGVIDYVGKNESLVRLISDPSVHPAVRVARGFSQNHQLDLHIEALLRALKLKNNLFANPKDTEILSQNLKILKQNILSSQGSMLAKGELCGATHSKWRTSTCELKGIGFNYDFPDKEGEARDLRSSIIQIGDLLVTSGMDGIFPAGLSVAEVSEIDLLKEGSYAYEIRALATAGSFDEITSVFVLPSLNFDPESDK